MNLREQTRVSRGCCCNTVDRNVPVVSTGDEVDGGADAEGPRGGLASRARDGHHCGRDRSAQQFHERDLCDKWDRRKQCATVSKVLRKTHPNDARPKHDVPASHAREEVVVVHLVAAQVESDTLERTLINIVWVGGAFGHIARVDFQSEWHVFRGLATLINQESCYSNRGHSPLQLLHHTIRHAFPCD